MNIEIAEREDLQDILDLQYLANYNWRNCKQ